MARGPIPDKPRDRPTVPDVLPLARDYLAGNALGGNLHLVLEDGNLRDGDLRYCIDRAVDDEDPAGVELGRQLLAMTSTQRRRVYRARWLRS